MAKVRKGIAAAATCSVLLAAAGCHAVTVPSAIPFTSYRDDYESPLLQPALEDDSIEDFAFHRFQSPSSIQAALQSIKKRKVLKKFEGKDGRKGMVSSTKLCGDWVLAESKQVAVDCTVDEVLSAYMSSNLQEQWNQKDVIKCTFHQMQCDEDNSVKRESLRQTRMRTSLLSTRTNDSKGQGIIYLQDLVLRSQRVIRSHTGVMRYCQTVTIDKIGKNKYAVLVNLDPEQQQGATSKRPFESLSVYVGLEQNGKNVDIYAAGVMKVNRQVVPNLIVFDASGIAGGMAGKGTLWLAGHFEQRRLLNRVRSN